MKKLRLTLLLQALFATFLWSASKIILKLGLEITSPLLLIGCVQTVAFGSLLIYSWWHPIKLKQSFKPSEIYILVLLGMMGFVAAPLFSVIGLQYVAGTTAGLFAGISSVLVMGLSWLILREQPRGWQILGGLVAFLGAYVFLGDGRFASSLFGLLMLGLSELSYALNMVLTRLVMRRPGDAALLVSLAGSFLGMIILLPIGLLSGGSWVSLGYWQAWLIIVAVGLVFAFAGLIWNHTLNYLLSFEASILQNTMLVQIGVLSWIFLRETITWYHWVGAIIVLAGVYLVNQQLNHHAQARNQAV